MSPERTSRGLRLTFVGRGIEQIDGVVRVSLDGTFVIAGRAPSGRHLGPVVKLIVTSTSIERRRDRLWTRCSRCHQSRPLVEMGLRQMPTGEWRNQPQCPRCRSRRIANDNRAESR